MRLIAVVGLELSGRAVRFAALKMGEWAEPLWDFGEWLREKSEEVDDQ